MSRCQEQQPLPDPAQHTAGAIQEPQLESEQESNSENSNLYVDWTESCNMLLTGSTEATPGLDLELCKGRLHGQGWPALPGPQLQQGCP